MVGLEFSVADVPVPRSGPTRLAHGLPADTTAALAISGLGERAAAAFQGIEQSGALEELPGGDLGFSADDLRALLGTDLVVAVFGDLENPAFGVRVMTPQPEEAIQLVDGFLAAPDLGISVVSTPVEGGYAVGSDQATLEDMTVDGGLGDTDAFQAAVADPASASAIGYVALGALVDSVVAQGGPDAEAAKAYSAVEALGFSATGTDEGSRLVLRITTR
jgi:hypothetical protein